MMNSWVNTVAQLEQQGRPYVLVTILSTQGSTPRDSGTKMIVSDSQQWGTIGGGHLEYQVSKIATELLKGEHSCQKQEHFPLAAKLGQCCGGRVSVLFEFCPGSNFNIAIFGAGHVGRSLAGILSQLPCRLHWIDSRNNEFPKEISENTRKITSDAPADEVADLPPNSYFIVMTHNHPLDFSIAEKILKRGDARYVGVIGSDTKWRRFKTRFEHRGFDKTVYQTIHCPIGCSSVPGKRPVEVAVSIAAEIIAQHHNSQVHQADQQTVDCEDVTPLMEMDGYK